MHECGVVSCGENVYQICVEDYEGRCFSPETLSKVSNYINLYSVSLDRMSGATPPSVKELMHLAGFFADLLYQDDKAVLIYICDFLNPVPARKRRQELSSQEYRSRLFSLLFQRFVTSNGLTDYHDTVVEIPGTEESFYVHMISSISVLPQIEILARDLHVGFDK